MPDPKKGGTEGGNSPMESAQQAKVELDPGEFFCVAGRVRPSYHRGTHSGLIKQKSRVTTL